MRHFKEMIFLGNGVHSLKLCNKLHDRLEEGFTIIGGVQQGMPTTEELRRELKDILLDIVISLGYREIVCRGKNGKADRDKG